MEDWKMDVINFEVGAIETFLGIKFEGETLEEKEAFLTKYKQERRRVTSKLLSEEYEKLGLTSAK